MRKSIISLISILIIFSSCATTDILSHPGIGRIKEYDFCSVQVPKAFNGFRIAFISDFHYKSKFKDKELNSIVLTLEKLHPDVLLLGGDYQEGCEFVPRLFSELSRIKPSYGIYGIMGNNDYERCYDEIVNEMKRYGMKILEHECDTLHMENDRLILAGIKNPFNLSENGISPTLTMKPEDFVIMLTHTPDYAEDVDISNTDLVLAGHTHGGQITLGRLFVPSAGSKYGKKFLSGKSITTSGVPVITTNGLGTSKINLRLFAPSEIVLITLCREESVTSE